MALTQPAVELAVKTAFEGVYGVAPDQVDFNKFKSAMAAALIEVMTNLAVVNVTVTGVTATGPNGGPLPITSQPGVGAIT